MNRAVRQLRKAAMRKHQDKQFERFVQEHNAAVLAKQAQEAKGEKACAK